jgi:hypothetical protein
MTCFLFARAIGCVEHSKGKKYERRRNNKPQHRQISFFYFFVLDDRTIQLRCGGRVSLQDRLQEFKPLPSLVLAIYGFRIWILSSSILLSAAARRRRWIFRRRFRRRTYARVVSSSLPVMAGPNQRKDERYGYNNGRYTHQRLAIGRSCVSSQSVGHESISSIRSKTRGALPGSACLRKWKPPGDFSANTGDFSADISKPRRCVLRCRRSR